MVMTLPGCRFPDCEAQLMFADAELVFLRDYATKSAVNPVSEPVGGTHSWPANDTLCCRLVYSR